jgi:hypothetical protein
MPEDRNLEAAYTLSERGEHGEHEDPEDAARTRARKLSEIVEVVILAIVAVATAWSGYQAARWDGRNAFLYGISTELWVRADEADTLGGQQRLVDISTFNTWIEERTQGEEEIADLYVERFSPEFRVAFDAWLATRPFSNPDAPPGPSFMPEYRNALLERSADLHDRASETFRRGTEARETEDDYVRLTVLLAAVLFLIAVSQRFTFRKVRLAAVSLAGVLLLIALVGVVSLPRL